MPVQKKKKKKVESSGGESRQALCVRPKRAERTRVAGTFPLENFTAHSSLISTAFSGAGRGKDARSQASVSSESLTALRFDFRTLLIQTLIDEVVNFPELMVGEVLHLEKKKEPHRHLVFIASILFSVIGFDYWEKTH